MSHYCKLKAMKEFNKGTKPVFFILRQTVISRCCWNGILDGKRIIICYFNAYSVSIRFQELKGFD
jgi:hypothetical protein